MLLCAELEESLSFWSKNGEYFINQSWNENFDCAFCIFFLGTLGNDQENFDLPPTEIEENVGRAFNNIQREPRRASNIAFATRE